jgi:hypothetical protein
MKPRRFLIAVALAVLPLSTGCRWMCEHTCPCQQTAAAPPTSCCTPTSTGYAPIPAPPAPVAPVSTQTWGGARPTSCTCTCNPQ